HHRLVRIRTRCRCDEILKEGLELPTRAVEPREDLCHYDPVQGQVWIRDTSSVEQPGEAPSLEERSVSELEADQTELLVEIAELFGECVCARERVVDVKGIVTARGQQRGVTLV